MHPRKSLHFWTFLLSGVLSFAGECAFAQGTIKRLFGTSYHLGGSIYGMDLDGTRFSTLKVFSPDGAKPLDRLTEGDGFLYGMTSEGGASAVGVIFKVRTDGSDFSLIHEFNIVDGAQPQSGLVLHSNGFLYGGTIFGGANNGGVLFRIRPSGVDFEVIHHFGSFQSPTGDRPEGNLIEATDGKLYGMTFTGGASGGGVVYRIEQDGSNYQVLHNLSASDGRYPYGALLQSSNGDLYGMAQDGGANHFGVIFRMSTDGSTFSRIYDFNETDGAYPYGGLIEDQDGMLYGMTLVGGLVGNGTIFKIENDGSDFESLHSFTMPDGQRPRGTLTMKSGVLYGAVGGIQNGSLSFNGGIFKIDPDGSDFTILEQFDYDAGSYPVGTLMLHNNGKLYGFTSGSAKTNGGTVFSYETESDSYNDLFTFLNPSGKYLQGELIQGPDGLFYGMAVEGGAFQNGVVYAMQPDGTTFTVIHDFQNSDGIYPTGGLTMNQAGDLFGMTSAGGQYGMGSVFAIRQATGFEKIYDFDNSIGGFPGTAGFPGGTLLRDGNGYLYGLTGRGGSNDFGTIFKCNEDGSSITKLHDFDGTAGSYPMGSLILATDGMLYGMTYLGGANDAGVIFKISTTGTSFTKMYDFSPVNGSNPVGGLLQASDGDLYGVTPSGNVGGVIFTIKTNGTGYQILRNGDAPIGTLIQASSGDLYGVTQEGGDSNAGTIYKIKPDGTGYQKLHDMSLTNGIPLAKLLLADVPKMNQTITFDPLASKIFTDGPFGLTATASSGFAVDYSISDPSVVSITGNVVTILGAGSVVIIASQSGDAIYDPAVDAQQVLVVEKAEQTITFNAIGSLTYDLSPFALTATSSSSLEVSYVSSNTSVATVSGNLVSFVGLGSTDIIASQAGNSNYNAAPDVTRMLTVDKGIQSVSLGLLDHRTLGDAPFSITATLNSGLDAVYTSSNPAVATVSGNVITIVGPGSTTITVTQPGSSLFEPAAPVMRDLVIEKIEHPRLYGVSGYHSGSIFSLDLDGSNFETNKIFNPNGGYPFTRPIDGGDGFLYGTTFNGGAGVSGVVFRIRHNGTGFSKLHEFSGPDGALPGGSLMKAGNGDYYGTTYLGGIYNGGVLFRIKSDGEAFEVLKHFSSASGSVPKSSLIQASNGDMYGTTVVGGTGSGGVIFRIKPDGGGYQVLHAFSGNDGANPGEFLLQGADGKLYGMTTGGGANGKGTIFRIALDGTGFSKIFDFDGSTGSDAHGGFIQDDTGFLYGMTTLGGLLGKGVIFKIKLDGSGYLKLHDFGSQGLAPFGSLVRDVNGLLYGLASGGYPMNGVLFKIKTDGSQFEALHEFDVSKGINPGQDLCLTYDGMLYGYTSSNYHLNGGSIFKYDLNSRSFIEPFVFEIPDGSQPEGDLTRGTDNRVYGMTYTGGDFSDGVIFSMPELGDDYKILHHFDDGPGNWPHGGLVRNPDGVLFGVRPYGKNPFGENIGFGTIFSIRQDGTEYKIIHRFDGYNGVNPCGKLIRGTNGDLYGMTSSGAAPSVGTIYRIHEDGTGFKKLHDFDFTNGAFPSSSLLLASDDQLYGMTYFGGVQYKGVLFKIGKDGTGFTKLIDFTGPNGAYPMGSLIQGSDGKLYGMTSSGDSFTGMVFSINLGGGDFKILHKFNNDGAPNGHLIQVPSGQLYGMTFMGGSVDMGTVFRMNTNGSGFQTIHHMSIANGLPMSGLLLMNAVKLDQTILFEPISTKTLGEPTFTIMATSSVGLSVQFSNLTDKITLAGNQATMVKAGLARIQVNQNGTSIYNPAPPVIREFCINPAKPTITVGPPGTLTSNATAGNQWYFQGVKIENATSVTFSPTLAGQYTVNVTADGCASAMSTPVTTVITGDLPSSTSNDGIVLYPNPASDEIVLDLSSLEKNIHTEIRIYDFSGRQVETRPAMGGETLTIDLGSYSAGAYFMRVIQNSKPWVKSFIKK